MNTKKEGLTLREVVIKHLASVISGQLQVPIVLPQMLIG
jgi:hypothetical protein